MDDVRVGRFMRACRIRLGWRQVDLAGRAGVSQQEISLLERGHLDAVPLRILRTVLRVLDAAVELDVRWRGGAIDKLLDEGHAGLLGTGNGLLLGAAWGTRLEVTYSEYGERGSIDLLAWHAATRTVLVVEVKTQLTSIDATLRKHDEKVRLAARIARDREGWSPRFVSRLLILPDTSTSRRRVQRAASTILARYPLGHRQMRAWIESPSGAVAGILFLAGTTPRSGRRGSVSGGGVRVRTSRTAAAPQAVRHHPE